MQAHGSSDAAAPPPPDDEYIDGAVLGIVLERHPAPIAFAELVAELVDADERPVLSEPFVHDGVTHLVAAGLVRRHGDLVLATRAAVRFDELGL